MDFEFISFNYSENMPSIVISTESCQRGFYNTAQDRVIKVDTYIVIILCQVPIGLPKCYFKLIKPLPPTKLALLLSPFHELGNQSKER